MANPIPLRTATYKDLDIALYGHQDAISFRVAINPRRMVGEKDFRWSEAQAYSEKFADAMFCNMPLGHGFSVGHPKFDQEKCWNVTVRPPAEPQAKLWKESPNAAMIEAFDQGFKKSVVAVSRIDPESFRGPATARPASVPGGGVGSPS